MNRLPSAVGFMKSLVTNRKLSSVVLHLGIQLHPFGRLWKFGETLVPNHCRQRLKLVLDECFH